MSHTYKSKDNFIPYLNQKNIKGYNALLYAAFRGNLEIFEKLIKLGADLDKINSSGLNVLHLAVQGNHPNLIVYLIEKCGFNINSKDNNGRTALHWGISMNSKQAVDYLVYYVHLILLMIKEMYISSKSLMKILAFLLIKILMKKSKMKMI